MRTLSKREVTALCAQSSSPCGARKRDRHPQGVPLILSGGYRASGNLPVRRYTKRLVQTSKSDESNDPNGKQVGESAARGKSVKSVP